jgi:hypothetical protein
VKRYLKKGRQNFWERKGGGPRTTPAPPKLIRGPRTTPAPPPPKLMSPYALGRGIHVPILRVSQPCCRCFNEWRPMMFLAQREPFQLSAIIAVVVSASPTDKTDELIVDYRERGDQPILHHLFWGRISRQIFTSPHTDHKHTACARNKIESW